MFYRKSLSRKIFEVLNYTFFIVFCATIILPFLNIIAISLSDNDAVRKGNILFWPDGINFLAYGKIVTNWGFITSFINSVGLTAVNTIMVIFISLLAGYALSSKYMAGRKVLFIYIIIPMYFSGGIIPLYLLVNSLKLTNSYLALVLPVIVSPFYIMIFRNNISNLPRDLMESAEIDGAGEFTILRKIIIPLLMPVTMAFAIMSAVTYWNEWYYCLLFIRDNTKWTLQYRVKHILTLYELIDSPRSPIKMIRTAEKIHGSSIRMAALIVSVLPIFMVYPFMQRYFIHGIVVGAVKG